MNLLIDLARDFTFIHFLFRPVKKSLLIGRMPGTCDRDGILGEWSKNFNVLKEAHDKTGLDPRLRPLTEMFIYVSRVCQFHFVARCRICRRIHGLSWNPLPFPTAMLTEVLGRRPRRVLSALQMRRVSSFAPSKDGPYKIRDPLLAHSLL